MKDSAPRYRWQEPFLIVTYPNQPKAIETWGVNLFRRDTKVGKAGDLSMSLAGGEDGRPVYFRLLRRVK